MYLCMHEIRKFEHTLNTQSRFQIHSFFCNFFFVQKLDVDQFCFDSLYLNTLFFNRSWATVEPSFRIIAHGVCFG